MPDIKNLVDKMIFSIENNIHLSDMGSNAYKTYIHHCDSCIMLNGLSDAIKCSKRN